MAPQFRAPQGTRSAMSLRQLLDKMTSTKNIQKITKAMKMVASAKLKAAEAQLFIARPCAAVMNGWYETNVLDPEDESKHNAILALTSDKGLCGAINSAIIKSVRLDLADKAAAGETASLYVIGEKGRSALKAQEQLILCAGDYGKKPMNFLQASLTAEEVIQGEWDKLTILYNRYINMASYEQETLVTLSREKMFEKMEALGCAWEFEGDEAVILQDLAEFRLAFAIYSTNLENATSEQSARMSAMESSSKNAGELLSKLTIQYNRARQAKITTELIEIISGAESLKSGSD